MWKYLPNAGIKYQRFRLSGPLADNTSGGALSRFPLAKIGGPPPGAVPPDACTCRSLRQHHSPLLTAPAIRTRLEPLSRLVWQDILLLLRARHSPFQKSREQLIWDACYPALSSEHCLTLVKFDRPPWLGPKRECPPTQKLSSCYGKTCNTYLDK